MKKQSCKGRRKKRFFFRCDPCERFVQFKEFSARWDAAEARQCPDCGSRLRPCTDGESREAAKRFPARLPEGRLSCYEKYLAGPLWAAIRGRVLVRDGDRCRRCGGTATQVHHRSYHPDVIAGYRDEMLVSICGPCHQFIEFAGNGRKVSLDEANSRLDAA